GAGIKQTRPLCVFAHRVNVIIETDAVDDLLPSLAVVIGLEDVRRAVIQLITLRREISRSRFVGRRFDQADSAELRQSLRCNCLPLLSPVASYISQPIIRPGPYRVSFQTRGSDGEDRPEDFRSILIFGDWTSRI